MPLRGIPPYARRRTFSRSGHRRHGAINGDLNCNCNVKSNCNCRSPRLTWHVLRLDRITVPTEGHGGDCPCKPLRTCASGHQAKSVAAKQRWVLTCQPATYAPSAKPAYDPETHSHRCSPAVCAWHPAARTGRRATAPRPAAPDCAQPTGACRYGKWSRAD